MHHNYLLFDLTNLCNLKKNLTIYFQTSYLVLILSAFASMTGYQFYKIKTVAGLLFIPYVLWLLFTFRIIFSIHLNSRRKPKPVKPRDTTISKDESEK